MYVKSLYKFSVKRILLWVLGTYCADLNLFANFWIACMSSLR